MQRVLVAYASKNGSTAEIAEAIARELGGRGLEADCREAGTVRDLAPYGAVVLGSAVYAKRWRRPARRFLHRHGEALAGLPWWVFSSGPVGEPKPDEAKAAEWLEPPKIMAEAERLGVREHVVFGGRIPAEPRNFIERAMVKNTPPEFADRRDWDEIAAWAAAIGRQLTERPGIATAA
ncbi:MAG TPA: flavodoxin domain-containing protein [Solirubrobacteraceae bacterium]|nr:flavodoxin domain-containing protein [Solirubrobacteraceae bacterium]